MASFDARLSDIALIGLWVCLGWLVAGMLVSLLAGLPGVVGDVASRVAVRCTPGLMRRLARATVGTTLTAASVLGVGGTGAGLALDGAPRRPGAQSDRVPLPDLDRPTARATVPDVAGDTSVVRPPTESASVSDVVVEPGDTLWDIAAAELDTLHGPGSPPSNAEIAERWPRWHAANRSTIGPDPHLILPGQRLTPPG